MAKLKKGSEAAKAWGRKMEALRNSKKKGNINKPVFLKSRKVKTMSKKDKHRSKKKTVVHVVPAALEGLGVLSPGLNPSLPNGGFLGVFSSSNPDMSSKFGAVMGGLSGYTEMSALIPAGELVIAGMIAKWLGKKTGLNGIGTKEVRLF